MSTNTKPRTIVYTVKPFRTQILYTLAVFTLLAIAAIQAKAAEFEVFDGRNYNGRFYPRIDVIEWNEENLPSHMEFQNYGYQSTPIDMSFQLEEKNGKKVMLVRYKFKGRDEVLCRRVIAPGHFKKDFFVYKKMEKDREITYVSILPLPSEQGRILIDSPEKYASCEMPPENRMPASDTGKKGEDADSQKRVVDDTGAIKSKDGSVPFDF